jgi:hypothetical protein
MIHPKAFADYFFFMPPLAKFDKRQWDLSSLHFFLFCFPIKEGGLRALAPGAWPKS